MRPLIDGEIWSPIKGYESLYEVSTQGRVRSLPREEVTLHSRTGRPVKRRRRGRIRKPNKIPAGYLQVCLYKNGVGVQHLIHRLVCQAFIPNPNDLPEVNHKDGDKYHCHVDNLEWSTRVHNSLHSTRTLRKNIGENNAASKLTQKEVTEIVELLELNRYTLQEIGDKYKVTPHAIYRIKHGHNWSWLTGYGKEGN